MLPAAHRLRRSSDFSTVVRSGARASRGSVVVHAIRSESPDGPRIGFVVSKAVGNSVVRHRVSRRLRHVCGPLTRELPAGTMMVVRALPGCSDASSESMARDLSAAVAGVRRKLERSAEGAALPRAAGVPEDRRS